MKSENSKKEMPQAAIHLIAAAKIMANSLNETMIKVQEKVASATMDESQKAQDEDPIAEFNKEFSKKKAAFDKEQTPVDFKPGSDFDEGAFLKDAIKHGFDPLTDYKPKAAYMAVSKSDLETIIEALYRAHAYTSTSLLVETEKEEPRESLMDTTVELIKKLNYAISILEGDE